MEDIHSKHLPASGKFRKGSRVRGSLAWMGLLTVEGHEVEAPSYSRLPVDVLNMVGKDIYELGGDFAPAEEPWGEVVSVALWTERVGGRRFYTYPLDGIVRVGNGFRLSVDMTVRDAPDVARSWLSVLDRVNLA